MFFTPSVSTLNDHQSTPFYMASCTTDRRMTPAEIFARIDEVEVDDVRATAMKYMVDEDHALAALGPIDNLPSYEWIRRQTA